MNVCEWQGIYRASNLGDGPFYCNVLGAVLWLHLYSGAGAWSYIILTKDTYSASINLSYIWERRIRHIILTILSFVVLLSCCNICCREKQIAQIFDLLLMNDDHVQHGQLSVGMKQVDQYIHLSVPGNEWSSDDLLTSCSLCLLYAQLGDWWRETGLIYH